MKYAFVTGADTGLGNAFVFELVARGYVVFGGTRKDTETLPKIERVLWVPLELTSDESIASALATVRSVAPTLDLLINNAGVNKDSGTSGHKELVTKLDQLDRKALLYMFEVNAVAPMMLLKAFLPLLSAHPSCVINVSSCRASYHDTMATSSANYGYKASKAALNMLVACSVWDLPPSVRTFAVHPGDMKTSMNPDGAQDPREQACAILAITENWHEKNNGAFLNYDGTEYPR